MSALGRYAPDPKAAMFTEPRGVTVLSDSQQGAAPNAESSPWMDGGFAGTGRRKMASSGRFRQAALLTAGLLSAAGQLGFGDAWVIGWYPGGCRGQLRRVAPVPADGGFFGDVEQVG